MSIEIKEWLIAGVGAAAISLVVYGICAWLMGRHSCRRCPCCGAEAQND